MPDIFMIYIENLVFPKYFSWVSW